MEIYCGAEYFLRLMLSLDSAFGRRYGLSPVVEDEWGRRFFDSLRENYSEWAESSTLVYTAASGMLYQFAQRLRRRFGPKHTPTPGILPVFRAHAPRARTSSRPDRRPGRLTHLGRSARVFLFDQTVSRRL